MSQVRSNAVIVGGGIMGGDIATVFAANGWIVHVMSPSAKTREALPMRIEAGLKKLGADPAFAQNVKTYARLTDIEWSSVGMVVEAATEGPAAQAAAVRRNRGICRADVPIATNTSNFPIGEVGKDLKRRGRVLGLHFFMPAHLVPLVEIVSADATDPDIAERVVELMKTMGKAPIWVKKDVPGFVGNRLQHAMLREALYLYRTASSRRRASTSPCATDSVSVHRVRSHAAKGNVGLDTNFLVGNALYPILHQPESAAHAQGTRGPGRLGMKTRRGFLGMGRRQN
jgi:3-hydroxybutyryl-CoA dehydrogenase